MSFSLWSILVFITACALFVAAATQGSFFAYLIYCLIIAVSIRPSVFRDAHSVQRFILLCAATTPPLLLMATVFMPPGFAGIPYMGFLTFVFVALFVIVAALEASLSVNLFVVSVFWITVSVLYMLNAGTAPGRSVRIDEILLQHMLSYVAHGAIQLSVAWSIHKLARIFGATKAAPL